MHTSIKISLLVLVGFYQAVQAQEEGKKDIGTETVTVVKAYAPTISDAFKIKSVPVLNDSLVLQKKPISYSIFSVPVASTFTPAKGKATGIEKTAPAKLFNSSASIGLGNYNNALVDFYTSRALSRDQRFDVSLNHRSSRGDIPSSALDNEYYNTKLNGKYSKYDRYLSWGAHLGLQHQMYNWYGIPNGYYTEELVSGIDEKQHYFDVHAGAHIEVEDSFFKGANLMVRRFWDATNSGENRAVLKPILEAPLGEEMLTIKTQVDYLGGTFKNAPVSNETNTPETKYAFLQMGVNPNLKIESEELTLNLGATFVYGMDLENNGNNFYIYPKFTGSYKMMDDLAIIYGGIEGGLNQNSFYGFVEENPYVSPTMEIQPTDQQYDGYIGVKGQLLPNLSYNLKGSYMAENRKPLFLLNPENTGRNDKKGYYYGNSFQVFYDDVRTLGIFGELNVEVDRNFIIGINAEVFDYDTETGNPAWNLPNLTSSLFLDYQLGEQWFMGANLFFVGERDDLYTVATPGTLPENFTMTPITLKSYFDANAHVGYRINQQFSVFAKAHNIANQNYMRWNNYKVQGFQFLAGATYKFDL
ncbi:TonB-dependent receptor [Arenibacter lacus]|uniref:TonB-dependent receptor n=1 Tax=Arenibacter lacus TaxID=2608629 RepID=UPI00123DD80F|nr:TonB-dependent receptor [Arenibacter lacus]